MRKILILLILSLSVLNLRSQNLEPNALPFSNLGQSQQTQFLTGFQWSGTQKFNKLMKNNSNAGGTGYNTTLFPIQDVYSQTNKSIKQPDGAPIRICPAMVYEPTLIVTNPNLFNQRTNDNTNAIWGFTYMSMGEITNNTSDPNFNRLILRNKPYNSAGTTILSGLSEQPNFETKKGDSQHDGYFGHRWFLTVNLRKISNSTLAETTAILCIKLKYKTIISSNGALSGWQEMKFDSIPTTESYNLPKLYNTLNIRGIEQKKQEVSAACTSLDISKSMLPTINEDKTISTSFLTINPVLNSKYEFKNNLINPEFLSDINKRDQVGHIAEMDIEVKYYGGVDIAIDYIKIESENAYYLSRGYVDNLPNEIVTTNNLPIIGNYNYSQPANSNYVPKSGAATMNGIKQTIQSCINLLNDQKQANGIPMDQMFRYYIEDTESANPNTWFQLRYANLITNGIAITRDLPYKSDAYDYYTKSPNRYIGLKLAENMMYLPAPFINTVLPNQTIVARQGFKWSHTNTHSHYHYWDIIQKKTLDDDINGNPLNSAAETDLLSRQYTPLPNQQSIFQCLINLDLSNNTHAQYFQNVHDETDMLQIKWEFKNKRMFYDSPAYLYNSKPWFVNFFITPEFKFSDNQPYYNHTSPQTGEEVRMQLSSAVLKGAKGLFYDREARYYNPPLNSFPNSDDWQLGMASPLDLPASNWTNDYNNVIDNRLGEDYVYPNSLPLAFSSSYAPLFSSIESALGIATNRFYVGMRSTRLEVYKIHSWIRRLEQNNVDNLMNMQLVAWQGKGFKKLYNQDPSATTPNIMDTYIKTDLIRTAKIFQPNKIPNDHNLANVDANLNVNLYENPDSSFYDVTILRNSSQVIGNTNSFYLGIQNRRTDPLFWELFTPINQPNLLDGMLVFKSTGEFEDLCNSSNAGTRTKYQDYYWKRLGCRLIEIPLSGNFSSTPTDMFSVRIQELLANDNDFNNIQNPRWRGDLYCHKPNIYSTGSSTQSIAPPIIKVKMLPGEGKMLSVSKIRLRSLAASNGSCPGTDDALVTMNLAMSRNDSLVYDLVFENNTPTKAEQLAIIYEDANGEPLSIMPYDGIEVADYQLDNKIIPNSKAIILHNVAPKSKIKIGQLSCSKKNPGKFLYHLDVLNAKGERCTGKNCALVNNFRKESVESFDTPVSKVSIVPNPAKEKAELNFTIAEFGNTEIIIVDILGNQMLKIADYTAFSGSNSLSIDLSNYPVGMYNVLVKTSAGITSQKFSVVR